MRKLDHETMELEGYFFLITGMVPTSWLARCNDARSVEPAEYREPDTDWWRNDEPAIDVCMYGDSRWDRGDPATGWYLRDDVEQIAWRDQENHRIEIVLDEHYRLMDFAVAIDIRTAFSDFLDQKILMAELTTYTFFDFEDLTIVDPSRKRLLDKISQHKMTHVVFDSSGNLAAN